MLKMYTVVRNDLRPGQQAVQSSHALANFAVEHPAEFRSWQSDSNTLIQLKVSDGEDLSRLIEIAEDGGFAYTAFVEPDPMPVRQVNPAYLLRGNETFWYPEHSNTITAVAFAPCWEMQYIILRDLPLMDGRDSRSEDAERERSAQAAVDALTPFATVPEKKKGWFG